MYTKVKLSINVFSPFQFVYPTIYQSVRLLNLVLNL